MPTPRDLTLADGQLGTTAETLLLGTSAPKGYVSVLLYHVGTTEEETVKLTFQRDSGTARRIARVVLATDEGAIVRNIPIHPGDTLLGVTSNASTVDYIVQTADGGDFDIQVWSEAGRQTQRTTGTSVISGEIDVDKSPSIEDLLTEHGSILRKLLQGAELFLNTELVDPA